VENKHGGIFKKTPNRPNIPKLVFVLNFVCWVIFHAVYICFIGQTAWKIKTIQNRKTWSFFASFWLSVLHGGVYFPRGCFIFHAVYIGFQGSTAWKIKARQK